MTRFIEQSGELAGGGTFYRPEDRPRPYAAAFRALDSTALALLGFFEKLGWGTRIRTRQSENVSHMRGCSSSPDRPESIHEIKHDGYRLIVQREGKRIRTLGRSGFGSLFLARYKVLDSARR